MFTSKDYDLNKEYAQRQMQKVAKRQLAQEIMPKSASSDGLSNWLKRRSISIIFAIIAISFMLYQADTAQAQHNLDAGNSGSFNGGIAMDMILSVTALRDGETGSALLAVDRAIAKAPEVAAVHTLNSAVQLALGNHNEVLVAGRSALALDAEEFAAYYFMAQAAFLQEQYQLALEYYEAYLAGISVAEVHKSGDLIVFLTGNDAREYVVTMITECDHYLVAMNG